jgi:sugar lactone lactonase YvrE
VFVTDDGNHRLRQIDADGLISTIAGNGTASFAGDGGPATAARFATPSDVTRDDAGALYIADTGNHRIRMVDPSGVVTTLAGTGTAGFGGDNGQAADAKLDSPTGLVRDTAGNLYFSDTGNHRIRKITLDGVVTTYAGTGEAGNAGDGAAATAAKLSAPTYLALDATGNLYVSDRDNHRVRKIDALTRKMTAVAGTGTAGSGGDDGPAASAQLKEPAGLALGLDGSLYIADRGDHRIRQVSPTGTITAFAGTGIAGYAGDGGPATAAQLSSPTGVAIDPGNNVYISDSGNHRIRRITPNGPIASFIGTGSAGWADGQRAVARLNNPGALHLFGARLLFSDLDNQRIRRAQ